MFAELFSRFDEYSELGSEALGRRSCPLQQVGLRVFVKQTPELSTRHYWAVQAGLLTPLTFARHSQWKAAGGSESANFTLPALKAFWRPVVRMCLATSNNLLLVL